MSSNVKETAAFVIETAAFVIENCILIFFSKEIRGQAFIMFGALPF